MYRSCIFCSADLGSNDSIERFPVGRSVAFDAEKGRLWAVCGGCARWNLAPIEERWEAVEDAERIFRDTRLRVQSENVGLTKLADGTRLVRVGKALPGELAVWRYGRMLRRRRGAYAAAVGIGVGVPAAVVASAVVGSVAGTAGFMGLAFLLIRWAEWRPRLQSRSLLPYTGLDVDVFDLKKARFAFTFDAEVSVELEVREDELAPGMGRWSDGFLVLTAEHGRALLRRGMVQLNASGAGAQRVQTAVNLLAASGSADAFLRKAAADGAPLVGASSDARVRAAQMLAAEMAVHDDLERDALNGELSALEAMWREAEEIAGIADRLPDVDPEPPRLVSG
jgi:hypothetical protein